MSLEQDPKAVASFCANKEDDLKKMQLQIDYEGDLMMRAVFALRHRKQLELEKDAQILAVSQACEAFARSQNAFMEILQELHLFRLAHVQEFGGVHKSFMQRMVLCAFTTFDLTTKEKQLKDNDGSKEEFANLNELKEINEMEKCLIIYEKNIAMRNGNFYDQNC